MTTVGIATGAARGMGLECARRLSRMVDRLVLVDMDEQTLAQAAGDLSAATVEPFVLDVTDRHGLERLARRVGELGTLRAVAHAAGISPAMADWKRVLTVDLVGTAMLTDVLRPLTVAGTATVCFSSMSAAMLAASPVDPAADAVLDAPLDERFLERLHEVVGDAVEYSGAAYAWAKRGVQRLVQREAVRLGRVGARICSVSPGIIDTPMGRQEAGAQPLIETMVERTPLGRMGRADEIAAVVAFLLSDEASFLTGADVLVDGGLIAAMFAAGAEG